MKKTRRTAQVGDLIRAELSAIIQRGELQDPALKLATISDVEIATDLRYARVYVSVIGDDQHRTDAIDALRRLKGKLRHMLGERVRIRYTPELDFHLDTTAETSIRIESILKEVIPHEDELPSTEENEERDDDE